VTDRDEPRPPVPPMADAAAGEPDRDASDPTRPASLPAGAPPAWPAGWSPPTGWSSTPTGWSSTPTGRPPAPGWSPPTPGWPAPPQGWPVPRPPAPPPGPPAWVPPALPGPPRYWGATCLVGVLLIAVLGAGIIALIGVSADELQRAIAADEAPPTIAADGTVAVQPGVTVRVPAGWRVEEALEDGIHLSNGATSAHVVVRERGGPIGAIRQYVQESLAPDAEGLSWTVPSQTEIGGRPAARSTYSGWFWDEQDEVDGRLVAVEESGSTVLVDAWAPDGELGSTESDVDAMLESVEVE
jgi:hypothetical protein